MDEELYLSTAVFCESILEEKNGTNTLIRLVDQFVVTGHGENPPDMLPRINITLNLFVSFKYGTFRGRSILEVQHRTPAGAESQCYSMPIEYQEGRNGFALRLQLNIGFTEVGIHWFRVSVGGKTYALAPINIIYHKIIVDTNHRLH